MSRVALVGIQLFAGDFWVAAVLPMRVVAVCLFKDAGVDGNPAALVFAVFLIANGNYQHAVVVLHLHQILLFRIQLWKVLNPVAFDAPIVAGCNVGP